MTSSKGMKTPSNWTPTNQQEFKLPGAVTRGLLLWQQKVKGLFAIVCTENGAMRS
jgi:hypothetical protein